jgi:hypothetical protein
VYRELSSSHSRELFLPFFFVGEQRGRKRMEEEKKGAAWENGGEGSNGTV